MRDHRGEDERANAVLLGVSPDPVERIARFDAKQRQLCASFALLSDEAHEVAKSYGTSTARVISVGVGLGLDRGWEQLERRIGKKRARGSDYGAKYIHSMHETPKSGVRPVRSRCVRIGSVVRTRGAQELPRQL